MNVTRNAWLAAGLPREVPATTLDAQCGSSQQAANLAYALTASEVADVVMACGVELISQVPMGASIPKDTFVGKAINKSYWDHHEWTSQFEAAERIAEKWGITRADCDLFGKTSQDRARKAWADGRFESQILPLDVPCLDGTANPAGSSHHVNHDECLRETSLEALAGLKPTGRPEGVHTAGTSSQIADGASAVLFMTADRAHQLGVEPLATVVDVTMVGCDPVLMLEGPISPLRSSCTKTS